VTKKEENADDVVNRSEKKKKKSPKSDKTIEKKEHRIDRIMKRLR